MQHYQLLSHVFFFLLVISPVFRSKKAISEDIALRKVQVCLTKN